MTTAQLIPAPPASCVEISIAPTLTTPIELLVWSLLDIYRKLLAEKNTLIEQWSLRDVFVFYVLKLLKSSSQPIEDADNNGIVIELGTGHGEWGINRTLGQDVINAIIQHLCPEIPLEVLSSEGLRISKSNGVLYDVAVECLNVKLATEIAQNTQRVQTRTTSQAYKDYETIISCVIIRLLFSGLPSINDMGGVDYWPVISSPGIDLLIPNNTESDTDLLLQMCEEILPLITVSKPPELDCSEKMFIIMRDHIGELRKALTR